MTDPIVEGPAPKKRRRSHKTARDAGARMERGSADYMQEHVSEYIDRQVKRGQLDLGDIANVRTPSGHKIAVECKDSATLKLPEWLREAEVERQNLHAIAGVVIHKARGVPYERMGDQHVTMTLRDLVAILTGKRPTVGQEEENDG